MLLFLAILFLSISVEASLHEYVNVEFPRDALMFRKSGMYGPLDTPSSQGSPSFIRIDLTLERQDAEFHGESIVAQIAIFDEREWDKIGIKGKTADGSTETVYCCTKELVTAGTCTEPMTLIFRPDSDAGSYITRVEFKADPATPDKTGKVRVEGKFPIPNKGIKVLMFATCNDMAGTIIINGQTEWKSPYGYLPGELYGFLPFYSQVAMVYLIIALLWAILCLRHWRELMILQTCVTLVICFGMMEMGLRYFDMVAFNQQGTRGSVLMFTGSLFHTVKQTVTRLLILVVALGFGVVKPSLGSTTYRVLALGSFYFFFSATQRVFELASHTSSITLMQYILLLPVAFLDLVFFFWIFLSTNQIIAHLSSRDQGGVKLELYLRFRRLLIGTMLAGSLWSLVYAYIVVSGKIFEDWESRWFFEGFFDMLYLVCLLGIMILWRPTNNSQAFAYHKVSTRQKEVDDDDEEEYGHELAEEVELAPTAKVSKELEPVSTGISAVSGKENGGGEA